MSLSGTSRTLHPAVFMFVTGRNADITLAHRRIDFVRRKYDSGTLHGTLPAQKPQKTNVSKSVGAIINTAAGVSSYYFELRRNIK